MINKLKKAFDILVTILFVLTMSLTLLIVGSKICGMHLFTVLTGSMEPTYHTGSLILVQPTATSELQKDDIITYMVSETKVLTHRIVEVVPDQNDPNTLRFCTKGDANNANDPTLVHQKNVIGKPVFEYPPLRIKQAVVGFGRAGKAQVAGMTKQILRLSETLPFDESDAAAAALCHAYTFRE